MTSPFSHLNNIPTPYASLVKKADVCIWVSIDVLGNGENKAASVISKLVELRTSLGIRTHRYTLLKEGPCPFSASVFPTLRTAEGMQGGSLPDSSSVSSSDLLRHQALTWYTDVLADINNTHIYKINRQTNLNTYRIFKTK